MMHGRSQRRRKNEGQRRSNRSQTRVQMTRASQKVLILVSIKKAKPREEQDNPWQQQKQRPETRKTQAEPKAGAKAKPKTQKTQAEPKVGTKAKQKTQKTKAEAKAGTKAKLKAGPGSPRKSRQRSRECLTQVHQGKRLKEIA